MRKLVCMILCLISFHLFGFELQHPSLPGADTFNINEFNYCKLQMGFELSKKHYIIGEPIHFKRFYTLVNNKDGLLCGKSTFYIRNRYVEYKGTPFYTSGQIYSRAKVKRFVDCPTYMGYKYYYGPSHMEGNLYRYFWDYPDLQFTIKPGKYWIVGTYVLDSVAYKSPAVTKIVYPGSTIVYIDTVPDKEKPAMKLLQKKRYRELMNKFPHSIYYPSAEFELLRLKCHEFAVKKLDNKIYDVKLKDEIKDLFYDLVRNYPYFCIGENASVIKMKWAVLDNLIFTHKRKEEAHEYYERLTKDRGNNPMLNYFYKGLWLMDYKFRMKEGLEKVKEQAESKRGGK